MLGRTSAYLIIVAMGLALGCSRSPAHPPATVARGAGQTIVDGAGTYALAPGDVTLTISLRPAGSGDVVEFALRDAATGNTLASGDAGNNAMRWFLFWSSSRELWVYSGDLGTTVWREAGDGRYESTNVASDESLIRRMPARVFAELPESSQERWAESRE